MIFDIRLIESHLDNLEKRIKDLAKTEAMVGYKMNQGTHISGLYYTDLMSILHNGIPSKNLPARPIFSISLRMYDDKKSDLAKTLKKYFSNIKSKTPPIQAKGIAQKWATDFGETMLPLFGDNTKLASNAPVTQRIKLASGVSPDSPLLFTGDLKSHLSYWIDGQQYSYGV